MGKEFFFVRMPTNPDQNFSIELYWSSYLSPYDNKDFCDSLIHDLSGRSLEGLSLNSDSSRYGSSGGGGIKDVINLIEEFYVSIILLSRFLILLFTCSIIFPSTFKSCDTLVIILRTCPNFFPIPIKTFLFIKWYQSAPIWPRL